MVRAVHNASYRSMFSATQIGFLVNFTLPARIGEVVRAYVLARQSKIPLPQCMAMASIDRLNDLFILLGIIFVAIFTFPTHNSSILNKEVINSSKQLFVSVTMIRAGAASIAVFFSFALFIAILVYLNQKAIARILNLCRSLMPSRITNRICDCISDFTLGMHVLGSYPKLSKSIFFSLVTWLANILSVAAILRAFSIDFAWYVPFLMLALIAVFISIPVTPGVIGQYHIPVIACLLLAVPGMKVTEAKAVAIVAHILNLIPIAILGTFCLCREQVRFFDLVGRALQSRKIVAPAAKI